MLIVGPAILQLSDPTNEQVSVFTQTMDQLLPAPLAYLGTLVGIAVLLSASAASAQGLQNLALGLKDRHYIPAIIGQRNRFDVADKPVWIEVGLVSLCFLVFGTSEETYLAIYAAGVFILLSMTGWAASKRLLRNLRADLSAEHVLTLIGTTLAALLTTGATIIIFEERFLEGAWTFFVLIPILYAIFTYFRRTLGAPSRVKEQLGELEAAMLGGFGLGQSAPAQPSEPYVFRPTLVDRQPASLVEPDWRGAPVALQRLLVPLDGSSIAEHALPMAETICRAYQASLMLVSVLEPHDWSRFLPATKVQASYINETERAKREGYLSQIVERVYTHGNSLNVDYAIGAGPVADQINTLACDLGADLVVMSANGRYGVGRWLIGGVANKMVQLTNKPTLLIPSAPSGNGKSPQLKKLLVALDGSEFAERVLPFARSFANHFGSQVLLLSVPEVPETRLYGAMGQAVEGLRAETETRIYQYLESITTTFAQQGLESQSIVTGSGPARTIVSVSEYESIDLIMLATHGLGGRDRLLVGSIADRVVHNARCPVFLVPIGERRPLSPECAPQPALDVSPESQEAE
jgi:nucleotide-binding universal stress UspA family protein